ncbi:MAG: hypothetical protein IIW08_03350 [Clostridia bacterium]|nr:hypothetical protein [Clostridia bacterium]
MKKINMTDITLKALSQDRAVSLLFREKTAIAACAASLCGKLGGTASLSTAFAPI